MEYFMKRIIILSIAILFSSILFSCENNIQPDNSKFTNFTGLLQQYTGNYYTRDDLKNMYNNGNLTGIIIFFQRYRNDLILTGGTAENPQWTSYDGYDTDADGIFFNTGTYLEMQLGAFELNAMAMRQYQDGYYTPWEDIDIYMGGGVNKWVIEPYNDFPGDTGEVAFANEIHITNLNRLDTLDIRDTTGTNGFDLTWTGGSSLGKIELKINKTDISLDEPYDGNTHVGMIFFTDYSTSYHFDNKMLDFTLQREGLYDVTVTYYEPHLKTLSNGKQILLIGKSAHNITVYLKRNPIP